MGRDQTWKKRLKFGRRHEIKPALLPSCFEDANPNPSIFSPAATIMEPSQLPPTMSTLTATLPPATFPLNASTIAHAVGHHGQPKEPPRPVFEVVFVVVQVVIGQKALDKANRHPPFHSFPLYFFDVGYVVAAAGGLQPLFSSFSATSAAQEVVECMCVRVYMLFSMSVWLYVHYLAGKPTATTVRWWLPPFCCHQPPSLVVVCLCV